MMSGVNKKDLQGLASDLDEAVEAMRDALREVDGTSRYLRELALESWPRMTLNVHHAFVLPLTVYEAAVLDATQSVVAECKTIMQAEFIVAAANAAGGFA